MLVAALMMRSSYTDSVDSPCVYVWLVLVCLLSGVAVGRPIRRRLLMAVACPSYGASGEWKQAITSNLDERLTTISVRRVKATSLLSASSVWHFTSSLANSSVTTSMRCLHTLHVYIHWLHSVDMQHKRQHMETAANWVRRSPSNAKSAGSSHLRNDHVRTFEQVLHSQLCNTINWFLMDTRIKYKRHVILLLYLRNWAKIPVFQYTHTIVYMQMYVLMCFNMRLWMWLYVLVCENGVPISLPVYKVSL